MTSRAGSIPAALAWLEMFNGEWGYDTAAGASTRYGPRVHGQKFPSNSSALIADCSGAVIRAAVEGGMPRYHEGIPESSGSANAWAEDHPDLLLWCHRGGARYRDFDTALWNCRRGTVFGIGDHENGDDGHEGFVVDGKAGTTLESSSGLHGLRHGSIRRFSGRLSVTHLYELPMHYDGDGGAGFMAQLTDQEQHELLDKIRNMDKATFDLAWPSSLQGIARKIDRGYLWDPNDPDSAWILKIKDIHQIVGVLRDAFGVATGVVPASAGDVKRNIATIIKAARNQLGLPTG